ncbi:uncharacterized protein I206_107288 [Kwoniella pini CBS 10737]|uniref:Uncharacterized protein n=1 Tax=Kwoniella pini CBS 10737 TaxID=1296096 RepID=A0AAJ8MRK9_9TREE
MYVNKINETTLSGADPWLLLIFVISKFKKGTAACTVSILGLTFSIWSGIWATYMLVVSHISAKKNEARASKISIISPERNYAQGQNESIPLLSVTLVESSRYVQVEYWMDILVHSYRKNQSPSNFTSCLTGRT